MNRQLQAHASKLHLLFLVLLGITVFAAFLLVWVHGFVPTRTSSSTVDLIVEEYKRLMAPEPTEQFVFAVLAMVVPTLCFALTVNRSTSAFARSGRAAIYLPIIIAGLFLCTIFGSDLVPTVARDFRKPYSPIDTGILLAAVVAAVLLCAAWVRQRKPSIAAERTWTSAAWVVFLVSLLLQMASWRIVSFASVLSTSPSWDGHADPLFYVMAQVREGKTLLADLPSQYGLFPEILDPIFRLIGLSVGTASALFSLLQVVSMICLFFVLEKFVKNRQLLMIAGLALVLLTFGTVLIVANYEDPYFQNWPLRFFWPATSVAAFHWFTRRPSYLRAAILSALSAVALLWNLDSGLFIAVAFGSYLMARAFAGQLTAKRPTAYDEWRPRTYAFSLAAHVAITAAIVAAFMCALTLKAGRPLHFAWLFEYQRIFADLGLAMLPLPRRPHPWMAVLAVYLWGMLQAFLQWRLAGRAAVKADMLFYLSMLGLGLFVYYLGRSHVLNLVTVCWPAAMLVAIYADDIVRLHRAKAVPPSTITIAVVGCAMLLIAAGSVAARLPSFAERTLQQFTTRGQASDPLVGSELAFIKKHAPPGSQCLILTLRQGIYHAQARVASPFQGPGLIEMALVADQRRMMDRLLTRAYSCVFVGVGPRSAPNFRIDLLKLLEAYNVAAESPGGTMLYLNPGSSPRESPSNRDAEDGGEGQGDALSAAEQIPRNALIRALGSR